MDSIGISDFVRRQTPDSHYAHFDGTEDQLLALLVENWHTRRESGAGIAVRVFPAGFWSSTITIDEDIDLHVDFKKRREGEESHVSVTATGNKVSAKRVDIILYHRETLLADGEEVVGTDWEVISINAYPEDAEPPMRPITMARNFLDETGGTKVEYTAEQFAEAIWYWSQHTGVRPPQADPE